ncbi:MAG: HEPN domain-containing protein [Spirochaetota bacterium]
MASREKDWLRQAEEELLWAGDAIKTGRWALVCLTSQQVAELCLKAIAIHRGALQVKSHSIKEIAQLLGINGEIEGMAKALDLYYMSTRYPDAFSSGAPFEYFSEHQANEAFEYAKAFVKTARSELDGRVDAP